MEQILFSPDRSTKKQALLRGIPSLLLAALIAVLAPGCAGKKAQSDAESGKPVREKVAGKEGKDLEVPLPGPVVAAGSGSHSLGERAGSVWIVKPDGSKSCGVRKGISPKDAARELEQSGVKVLKQRVGHDGKMRMMVCGADTGAQVELLIDGKGLPTAGDKGFRVKSEN